MDGVQFTITLSGAASEHDEDLREALHELQDELSELAEVQVSPVPQTASVRPSRGVDDVGVYVGLAAVVGATVVRPVAIILVAWLERHKNKGVSVERTTKGRTLRAKGYSRREVEAILLADSAYAGNGVIAGQETVVGD
ncbi:hypothetical protein [Cryptosporangium sp. NPDC051539]|uniref:hypothetical protein n=1 Tax=Cryptosporangium sp. NPDC051539 TaxID=3363962 RepID=UPI00378C4BB5